MTLFLYFLDFVIVQANVKHYIAEVFQNNMLFSGFNHLADVFYVDINACYHYKKVTFLSTK